MCSADTLRAGSPSLAGHRGLKDPEIAKYLGNTLHSASDKCLTLDSCAAVNDIISTLTRAMSGGLFQVEYHAATSKAPSYESFVLEVAFYCRWLPAPSRTNGFACRN